MSDLTAVVVAVLLLAFNAFFVGAEFALLSARRSQIEPLAQAGSRPAGPRCGPWSRSRWSWPGPSSASRCARWPRCRRGARRRTPARARVPRDARPDAALHPVSFVVAMSIVVYLHVVLGEMVPKNIAIAGPTRAALVLGPPMMVIVTVLRPVISLLNLAANGILRLMRVEPKDEVS